MSRSTRASRSTTDHAAGPELCGARPAAGATLRRRRARGDRGTRELLDDSPGRRHADGEAEPVVPANRSAGARLGRLTARRRGRAAYLPSTARGHSARLRDKREVDAHLRSPRGVRTVRAAPSASRICRRARPRNRAISSSGCARSPELQILVGRWAPHELVDDNHELLVSDGATHVGSTLIESRDHLESLLPVLSATR